MKKLALYGAGGLGLWMLELYMGSGLAFVEYDQVFFVDDADIPPRNGVPVTDFAGMLREAAVNEVRVAICIGQPEVRHAVFERVRGAGVELATLVGMEARVSRRAVVGPGCIISGFSTVEPNVRIGENTLLLDSFVSRDCEVGESCVLDSKSVLSRGSRVGGQALVSVNAVVGENVAVGERAVVSMGAVAFDDVPEGGVAIGNPARLVGRGTSVGSQAMR